MVKYVEIRNMSVFCVNVEAFVLLWVLSTTECPEKLFDPVYSELFELELRLFCDVCSIFDDDENMNLHYISFFVQMKISAQPLDCLIRCIPMSFSTIPNRVGPSRRVRTLVAGPSRLASTAATARATSPVSCSTTAVQTFSSLAQKSPAGQRAY